MGRENKSYRIRTNVSSDNVVNFSIDNTIDTFEILSLKIDQKNTYRLMGSNTGVIVGRVLANGGFGVPNVKVSVFIEYEDTDNIAQRILYHYTSTKDMDNDGVRYNLLPNEIDDECHQNIGTFPSKRVLLDNDNWIEIFDKYYKFTTRTNDAGDYMIYGVPTGNQTVHMDVDLSDIGILSQRPRDLIYKGYNANMFENMTKFKVDTNIDSLAQVITQDQAIYVYPFWGDTTDSELNASITRCDLNINYKFEPTCIFMGSVITDAGENAMTQKCIGAKKQGQMSEMITGEGRIEMIRKTANGQIEQFSVKGDNNINSDGVWCYQIPMNLDYVKTDEFGKMVMSDDPNTGLPTRTRVRFRLSMAESPSDVAARKRARYLIPNNPRLVETDYPSFCENMEIDYEFGTKTKDENFRDLFWNNVYTVKSYIPRLQKSRLPNSLRHLGIKMVNHSGSNNPMPFNNLRIKFNFVYMFLCTLVKVLVTIVGAINKVLTTISYVFYQIGSFCFNISKDLPIEIAGTNFLTGPAKLFAEYNGKCMADISGVSYTDFLSYVKNEPSRTSGIGASFCKIFLSIGCGIQLSGLCETDDGTPINITPGTNQNTKTVLQNTCGISCNNRVDLLYNCVENQLAQENEVTSFNFYNDWINGVVYLPLWYRKIKKRRNGTIRKDNWCSTDNTTIPVRSYKKNLRLYSTMTPTRVIKKGGNNSMGALSPLVNNENTVRASGDNETGAEVITFTRYNEDNCYGYQCHKYSRAYFKVYKGLVFEKETMLGDKVYYYKPCDYDKTTGNSDLVTLFATDLVLLGSLNECDMHGIPQFFKALESTTYNMPPDLLSETYDYINEDVQTMTDENDDSEIDLGSRITEYTGADWGNLGADQSNYKSTIISFGNVSYSADANENEYDNGGLFYGLTCFNSYTKPKSCINLSRICEFGVSLDETQELPNSDGSSYSDDENLTPDGFVSYDEIYNPDYRSMFATLNANFLKTKLNPETGLLEYDFNHMYVDNFDGSLQLLMQAKTVNGNTEKSDFQSKANYILNYQLEQSSDAYLNFRYGKYIKRSGNYIYYYDASRTAGIAPGGQIPVQNKIPRYENSFYFYFGLNEGKTAIDKFNNEFFSDCKNNFASDIPYDMTYQGNSWCPVDSRDGFIALNINVDAPLSITFTNKDNNDIYYQKSINKQKIIFYGGDEIPEGYENYTKYTLIQKQADGTNTVNHLDILPKGTYKIEMTDAYDNVYTDSITFELPRIGFVCDVNPFNCKNSDLIGKLSGNTIKDTYTNIANYINYEPYKKDDVIEAGSEYYEKTGNTYTRRETQEDIIVTSDGQYYYRDRDIRGFVSISDVTEGKFKIKLEPLDTNFFGPNYNGCQINVEVTENRIIVTDTGGSDSCGYLGYKITNGIASYWFGVPYANKRYRFTITQICENGEESNNVAVINVIIYEDEFKFYINDIDYDIISAFKSGWNDTKLKDGNFINENEEPGTYDSGDIYGWNDILNIGSYTFDNRQYPITKLEYTENKTKVISICNSLSSAYENNGTGVAGTTPYKWINDYCYDAPSTEESYYNEGTIQRGEYIYEIPYRFTINDSRVIYDINGNALEATDMVYTPDYRKYDIGSTIAYNEIYYTENGGNYIQHVNKSSTIIANDKYYAFNQVVYYLTNNNVDGLFIRYRAGEYINTNEIYYTKSNGNYVRNVNKRSVIIVTRNDEYYFVANIDGIAIEGRDYVAMNYVFNNEGKTFIAKDVDTDNDPRGIVRGETYYKDNEHTVSAVLNVDYLEDVQYTPCEVRRIDSYDSESGYTSEYKLKVSRITVANEHNDGNITYVSDGNIVYSDLDCWTFLEYRAFIDEINEVIDNRGEFTRTVAAAFRINYDETRLMLTAQTKAKPVKYLIAGNSEITTVEDLYSYRSGQSIPNINEVTQEIVNGVNQIRYIDKGYVVDEYFETPEEAFKIPTLTYDNVVNAFIPYALHTGEQNDVEKHPYYVSIINDNDAIMPPGKDLSNFDENGQNKNLTTTFPVHFYNKPLKCELPIVMSFINNVPAYPKIQLGEINDLGILTLINGYKYRISNLGDYSAINVTIPNNINTSSNFIKLAEGDDVYTRFINSSYSMYVGDVKKIIQNYNQSQPSPVYTDEIFDIRLRRLPNRRDKIMYPGDVYYVEVGGQYSSPIPINIQYYLIVGPTTWTHAYYTFNGSTYDRHDPVLFGLDIPARNEQYYCYVRDNNPLYRATVNTCKYVNDIQRTGEDLYTYIRGQLPPDSDFRIYYPQTEPAAKKINTLCRTNPRYAPYNVGDVIPKDYIFYDKVRTPIPPESYFDTIFNCKVTSDSGFTVNEDNRYYFIDNRYIEHVADSAITVDSDNKYFRYLNRNIINPYELYMRGNTIDAGSEYYTLADTTGVIYNNTVEYYYPENKDPNNVNDRDDYLAKIVYYNNGNIKSEEYKNDDTYRYKVPQHPKQTLINLKIDAFGQYPDYIPFRYRNIKTNGFYYGESINSKILSDSWRPINVFMPGFMSGYLYNGIPKDEEKSNIKATLNDTNITFDTIVVTTNPETGEVISNEDVYSNINVKRLIYTDYDVSGGQHPRYGEYKLDSGSEKEYQYTEVPLIDDDLIYTDGYGDDYRHPIIGTLAVMAEYPMFMFRNNLNGDTTLANEDYLMTQSHYTNDNGYTKFQTTYYIYDLDNTDYPLYYSDVEGYKSNLRYDKDTDTFYFKEMPELLLKPDEFNCVSKSNSIQFNVSKYLRQKYSPWYTSDEYGNKLYTHLDYMLPKEKFFVLASVNNQISISPVLEFQIPRIIYNYNGFDFNDDDHNYIYLTAREKRDFSDIPDVGTIPSNYRDATHKVGPKVPEQLAYKTGRHYVEDFYYLNNYRFVIHLATFDTTKGVFNPDVYSQVYSVMEGTAEHCYIKVETLDDSGNRDDYCYVASAIRFKISPLGSYITDSSDSSRINPDLNFFVEDVTNVMRYCLGHQTTGQYHTEITEISQDAFENWDNRDWMWKNLPDFPGYQPDGYDYNRYIVTSE